MRTLAWAGVWLAVSLAVTVLLWSLGIPGFFLALFLPFLWFPAKAVRRRRCACGREAGALDRFCAQCGAPL